LKFYDFLSKIIIFANILNIEKSKLPFAIVGSNTIIEADGKSFRGRKYPWGVVNGKSYISLYIFK